MTITLRAIGYDSVTTIVGRYDTEDQAREAMRMRTRMKHVFPITRVSDWRPLFSGRVIAELGVDKYRFGFRELLVMTEET